MVVLKYGMSLILSVVITMCLFYFMQTLIQSGNKINTADAHEVLVDFVRLQQDRELILKNRKPKAPELPDEPPPAMPKEVFQVAVDEAAWSLDQSVALDAKIDLTYGRFVADGDYLPIVKVLPVYPRRALARGLIGWVLVTFAVNEKGLVVDPTIIENCAMASKIESDEPENCVNQPSAIFDKAALKAASRFKYKPKVIDGLPVTTSGVLNKITFTLEG